MSGGIDSSLAAVLLHEQGYDLVGMTMKTWDYAQSGGSKKETGCCSLDSINDARQIAVELGFSHYILDIRDEFGNDVVNYFTSEYLDGRTPNPCVMCNTHIKWDALLRRADMLGCDLIATGHYAHLNQGTDGRSYISKGDDANKDQSYALWGVSQESLARTIFPLAGLKKTDIKKMAAERGFTDLLNKSESYEICFVPDNDYRGFLKRHDTGLEERVAGGEFVLRDGTVVGKHEGYPFYTIGQRKGLGVALGFPAYVVDIDKDANRVVLGPLDSMHKNAMKVSRLNFQKYAEVPEEGLRCTAKIRYNHEGTGAMLYPAGADTLEVHFDEPVFAIAPGQSAVFYEGLDVIAGGWIMKAWNRE